MKGIKNFGIGTDIESIDRFRKLDLVDNNLFLNRIFTKNELDYCFSKEKAAPHLAARYAGKEAVMKALSSISKVNLNYNEIEILNNKNGVPMVRIHDTGFHNLQVYLSLSHCKDKAIAFATVVGGDCHEEG